LEEEELNRLGGVMVRVLECEQIFESFLFLLPELIIVINIQEYLLERMGQLVIVGDCCLTSNEQFFSYILERTV
jgi:hypothetical protein